MIYLYAGLGMAMMLPILVGLQMAISVSQLEQGERSISDLGGVQMRWAARERELKEKLIQMPSMPSGPSATCPDAPAGFIASDGCSFIEDSPEQRYVARIYQSDLGWSACFVSKDHPDHKCVDEV